MGRLQWTLAATWLNCCCCRNRPERISMSCAPSPGCRNQRPCGEAAQRPRFKHRRGKLGKVKVVPCITFLGAQAARGHHQCVINTRSAALVFLVPSSRVAPDRTPQSSSFGSSLLFERRMLHRTPSFLLWRDDGWKGWWWRAWLQRKVHGCAFLNLWPLSPGFVHEGLSPHLGFSPQPCNHGVRVGWVVASP